MAVDFFNIFGMLISYFPSVRVRSIYLCKNVILDVCVCLGQLWMGPPFQVYRYRRCVASKYADNCLLPFPVDFCYSMSTWGCVAYKFYTVGYILCIMGMVSGFSFLIVDNLCCQCIGYASNVSVFFSSVCSLFPPLILVTNWKDAASITVDSPWRRRWCTSEGGVVSWNIIFCCSPGCHSFARLCATNFGVDLGGMFTRFGLRLTIL